jgi:F0F1-type ATP synthase assembly protein I
MIKSLLDDEENQEEAKDTRSRFFKKSRDREEFLSIDLTANAEDDPQKPGESEDEIREAIRSEEPPVQESGSPEQAGDLQFKAAVQEREERERSRHAQRASELEQMLLEIENELAQERKSLEGSENIAKSPAAASPGPAESSAKDGPLYQHPRMAKPAGTGVAGFSEEPVITVPYEPESKIDSFRKSGLAWSAAIVLFGSVVFMLVLGWFADLLFGSSPWGKVVGIVLGSLIGFVQFFRITSQILKPGKSDFEKVSLRSSEPAPEDEKPGSILG